MQPTRKQKRYTTAKQAALARNIRRAREQAGLSLTQCAGLAKVHRQTLHNVEQGKHSLQTDTLCRLAVALDVSLEDLLAG